MQGASGEYRAEKQFSTIVVGAGLAGLTAAYRLAIAGQKPLVLERYQSAGGLARAIEVEGEAIDALYHHIFSGDEAYIALAAELGLEQEIEWLPSKMGVFTEGRLWDFGTPASLLRFRPLSFAAKTLFAAWTLYLQRVKRPGKFEDLKASQWIRTHMGEEVWEKIWGPLLKQKFAEMAEEVAMVWLWRKISLRGASRSRSGMGERLGYMRGSFIRLIDELCRRITDLGGRVELAQEVRRINRQEEGTFILETAKESLTAFRVLAAVPAKDFLVMAGHLLESDERKKIASLKTTGALCTFLEMKHSLTPYYWLNIVDAEMPFGGLIEHTNYVPRTRYGNRHILYISRYLFTGRDEFQEAPSAVMKRYLPALKRVNPDFDESWILRMRHFRAESAQPVVTLGYRKKIPPMKTSAEGLFFCTMAQIYPEDRGQNYAVVYGQRAAKLLLESMGDR